MEHWFCQWNFRAYLSGPQLSGSFHVLVIMLFSLDLDILFGEMHSNVCFFLFISLIQNISRPHHVSPCSANNNINILSTNAYFEKHYILEVINQKVPRANRGHIWNHDEWVVPVVLTLSLYICVHIYINGIILYTDHKIACIVFPSAKSSTMVVDAPRTETQLFQLKHAPDHVDPSYLAKHWHPCAQIHS